MKLIQAGLPPTPHWNHACAQEGLWAFLALARGEGAVLRHDSVYCSCDTGRVAGNQLGCSPGWVPPWAVWQQQTELPPPSETPHRLSCSPAHPGTVRPWPSPHHDLCSRLLCSPVAEPGPHLQVEASAVSWGNNQDKYPKHIEKDPAWLLSLGQHYLSHHSSLQLSCNDQNRAVGDKRGKIGP